MLLSSRLWFTKSLFDREGKKVYCPVVLYSTKSNLTKDRQVLQVFKSKETPCFMQMPILIEAFLIFHLTWSKDNLESLIQMSDPLNQALC